MRQAYCRPRHSDRSVSGEVFLGGVNDLINNSAWVCVGIDQDPSVFAVATIEKWWQRMDKEKYYPDARRIFTTADSGRI
jgi:hypothetical protein